MYHFYNFTMISYNSYLLMVIRRKINKKNLSPITKILLLILYAYSSSLFYFTIFLNREIFLGIFSNYSQEQMVCKWQDGTQNVSPDSKILYQIHYILQNTFLVSKQTHLEGKLLLYNLLIFYIPYYQQTNKSNIYFNITSSKRRN